METTLTAFQSPPRLSLLATPKPSDTTCCVCQETLAAFKTQKVWLSATRRLQKKKKGCTNMTQSGERSHAVRTARLLHCLVQSKGRRQRFGLQSENTLISHNNTTTDSWDEWHWPACCSAVFCRDTLDPDIHGGWHLTRAIHLHTLAEQAHTGDIGSPSRTMGAATLQRIHLAPKCPRSKFDWATWDVFMAGCWHDEPPQDPGFPPECCTVSSLLLSEVLMLWLIRTSFNNPPSCW